MKKIEIRCTGSEMLPLSDMEPLQGSLKELTKDGFEKLKSSLLENGFCFPFFAWREVISGKRGDVAFTGKIFYLDGTQRDRVLSELAKDKTIKLPTKYPVVFVQAQDRKEAAKLILLQSSRYGKISDETLYEFLHNFEIDFSELRTQLDLPDINIGIFEKGYVDEAPTELPETSVEGETEGVGRFILTYRDEDQKEALLKKLGIDGKKVVYAADEIC